MGAHVISADGVSAIKDAWEENLKVVYVTFGKVGDGCWRRATGYFADHMGVELFLLAKPEDLDGLEWTAERSGVGDRPFGNQTPKGVFFSKGGGKAYVLTGNAAGSSSWLAKGRKAAADAQ